MDDAARGLLLASCRLQQRRQELMRRREEVRAAARAREISPDEALTRLEILDITDRDIAHAERLLAREHAGFPVDPMG